MTNKSLNLVAKKMSNEKFREKAEEIIFRQKDNGFSGRNLKDLVNMPIINRTKVPPLFVRFHKELGKLYDMMNQYYPNYENQQHQIGHHSSFKIHQISSPTNYDIEVVIKNCKQAIKQAKIHLYLSQQSQNRHRRPRKN